MHRKPGKPPPPSELFEHQARTAEPGAPASPTAAPRPIACPTCGTAVPGTEAFCPSCGLEMAKGFGIGRGEAAAPETCAACGTPLGPRDAACGFCGSSRALRG